MLALAPQRGLIGNKTKPRGLPASWVATSPAGVKRTQKMSKLLLPARQSQGISQEIKLTCMDLGVDVRSRAEGQHAQDRGVPLGTSEQIREFHRVLASAWGPQHWWPAHSRFEVIVGAYLTQNTAWSNVERALANLRAAGALNIPAIRQMPLPALEQIVRPAGYFRQKAQRLRTFVAFLDARYHGSLTRMFSRPTRELRQELLALNGVGPETADSILLYSGNHPVFVVDAYTRRLVERHRLIDADSDYEAIRACFEESLAEPSFLRGSSVVRPSPMTNSTDLHGAAHSPSAMSNARRDPLAQVYNEMHAFIVGIGKRYCWKTAPDCATCPLQRFLPQAAGSASMPGTNSGCKTRARRASSQRRDNPNV